MGRLVEASPTDLDYFRLAKSANLNKGMGNLAAVFPFLKIGDSACSGISGPIDNFDFIENLRFLFGAALFHNRHNVSDIIFMRSKRFHIFDS